MQDGDATDTARSQKRETPEDTDTAQEPERRVRQRETPVDAASAAAPEPEEEVENAPAKAESNNGDAVEDKDGEDGDTVASDSPRRLQRSRAPGCGTRVFGDSPTLSGPSKSG